MLRKLAIEAREQLGGMDMRMTVALHKHQKSFRFGTRRTFSRDLFLLGVGQVQG